MNHEFFDNYLIFFRITIIVCGIGTLIICFFKTSKLVHKIILHTDNKTIRILKSFCFK